MDLRNLDFHPADKNIIVERILTKVHRQVDHLLPSAPQAPSKYIKTVFNEEEKTGLMRAAIEHEKKIEEQQSRKPQFSVDIEEDTKENNVEEDVTSKSQVKDNLSSFSKMPTQAGLEFSQMYSAIDQKAVRSKKELVIVVTSIIVLAICAAAYYYFIEMQH